MLHVLYWRESLQASLTGTFAIYQAYLSRMEEDYEMHSMKRHVLSSRNAMVVAAAGLVLGFATFAYGADGTSANAVRHVRGRTIVSEKSPSAELRVQNGFRFIGTQQVNLYGVAEAEQYLFVRSGPDKIVNRFYWIQFEHFLPTNNRTYNYDSTRTTQIGDLQFIYNVGSWPDYAAAVAGDPASDGAAIERLLAKRHLSFPQRAVHVRMFHLPSADHRTELMIIYGEALPHNTAVPVRNGGVQLDTESPRLAQTFLEHARQGLIVQTR
jgi:hypothetical protein